MSAGGPAQWDQPAIWQTAGGDVPAFVTNGSAYEGIITSFSASVPEQGVYVEQAGGQHVPHVLLQSAAAPAFTPWEGEIEVALDDEDVKAAIEKAALLASIGQLSIWLDVWATELWLGNASRTTFGLARSTGYGSTGVTWAQRPARCFVDGTEQTMVTAAPAAGECQISQTADATSFVLGSTPASGAIVEFRYYPIRECSAAWGMEFPDFNEASATLELVERVPVREYASS